MQANGKITRKEQIALRATELFKMRGFTATSMRDLANDLGIEAASLYSHIRSKEELLQKICFSIADEFFEALKKIDQEELSPSQKLEQAIIAHIKVITNNTSASAVFFNEWRHLSEPWLSSFLKLRNDYEKRFIVIISEGIQKGEFSTIDEKFASLTLLSSLNWVHTWYKPKGKMTPIEIGRQLAALMINGLKKNTVEQV